MKGIFSKIFTKKNTKDNIMLLIALVLLCLAIDTYCKTQHVIRCSIRYHMELQQQSQSQPNQDTIKIPYRYAN